MKVIVTGGSGRVGCYAVRELVDAGHEVVSLDRARPPEPAPGGFIQLDLADAGEVYDAFAQIRPEGACHIAANPSPFDCRKIERFFGWRPRHSWRDQQWREA